MWTLTHTRHVIYIYLYLYGMQIDRKLMMNTWCTASESHKIHTADPQCIELNILDIIRTMMSFDATFKVKWSTFFMAAKSQPWHWALCENWRGNQWAQPIFQIWRKLWLINCDKNVSFTSREMSISPGWWIANLDLKWALRLLCVFFVCLYFHFVT